MIKTRKIEDVIDELNDRIKLYQRNAIKNEKQGEDKKSTINSALSLGVGEAVGKLRILLKDSLKQNKGGKK
jgi:hypothetical protein